MKKLTLTYLKEKREVKAKRIAVAGIEDNENLLETYKKRLIELNCIISKIEKSNNGYKIHYLNTDTEELDILYNGCTAIEIKTSLLKYNPGLKIINWNERESGILAIVKNKSYSCEVLTNRYPKIMYGIVNFRSSGDYIFNFNCYDKKEQFYGDRIKSSDLLDNGFIVYDYDNKEICKYIFEDN